MDDNQNYQNWQDQQNQQNAYQQNAYQQNVYQQPDSNYQNYQNYQVPYSPPPQLDLEEPVSAGEWLVTMLIMLVPCVNIVMIFIWAFGGREKKSKSNYFKAFLIMFGIVFVLYFIVVIAMAALGVSLYHLYL